MTFREPRVFFTVVTVTIVATIASSLGYGQVAAFQYLALAIGTVVIGIPHGATDDRIYRILSGSWPMWRFYLTYTVVAILYGALWFVVPTVAFILFLFISVYHFGQSNLYYATIAESTFGKKLMYVLWGLFVLGTPIVFRYQQSVPVIEAIIGYVPVAPETMASIAWPIAIALLFANLAVVAALAASARISPVDLVREITALIVLFGLFVFAPLYISFIVYWAFWHSLSSVLEISNLWDRGRFLARILEFGRAAAPLTIVTLLAVALIFGFGRVYGSRDALIALFFIIIAAVTLPHMFVMEALYKRIGLAAYSRSRHESSDFD